MAVKIKAAIVDPKVFEVLRRVNPVSRGYVWDNNLLELNGIKNSPTEGELRIAVGVTRSDETRAFDAYFHALGGDATKFEDIVEDATRGEFWEKLGFYFNAADHYSIAAVTAMNYGVKLWAGKLIKKADETYELWRLLDKSDPIGLGSAIASGKSMILDTQ